MVSTSVCALAPVPVVPRAAPVARKDLLCDELLGPRERAVRGCIEPWCRGLTARVERAREDIARGLGDIALAFEQAAQIACILDCPNTAEHLLQSGLAFFAERERLGCPGDLAHAFRLLIAQGRMERDRGHSDEALAIFERVGALPLGGSLEDGPLSSADPKSTRLVAGAPAVRRDLVAAVVTESLDTLLAAGRHREVRELSRVHEPHDGPALDAIRREANACALARLDLREESMTALAEALDCEPPERRPVFVMKRAELLAAFGSVEAARKIALAIGASLISRLHERPASFPELLLIARVCRLLAGLGDTEAAAMAFLALPHARAVGDVPLEVALALRVLDGEDPAARDEARALLRELVVRSGHCLPAAADALAREGDAPVPENAGAYAAFACLCGALEALGTGVL